MFVKNDLCWYTHSVFSVLWNKQWLQFWPYRNKFRHLFESSNTPGFNAKWSICFRKSDVLNLETVQRPQRHSTTHTNENENNICSPFYRSSSLRVWRQNGWLGLGMVTECAALTVCVKYNNIDCEYVSLEQHEFHILYYFYTTFVYFSYTYAALNTEVHPWNCCQVHLHSGSCPTSCARSPSPQHCRARKSLFQFLSLLLLCCLAKPT